MRDGCYVDTKQCGEVNHDQLISMIVGRDMSNLFPKEFADIGNVVLEIENLSSTGVFNDVSFSVRSGEIVGFCGLIGSGRTEIMSAVFGIAPSNSGVIKVNGNKINVRTPTDAISHGIGMITEDRLRLGAIHKLSVMANISVVSLKKICTK
jgi:ABC-type sugar transport system ATPase subunit